jgi:hypothetical protein
MNPRIIDWGVPVAIALFTAICFGLLVTAPYTYTPSIWYFFQNWGWYWL